MRSVSSASSEEEIAFFPSCSRRVISLRYKDSLEMVFLEIFFDFEVCDILISIRETFPELENNFIPGSKISQVLI